MPARSLADQPPRIRAALAAFAEQLRRRLGDRVIDLRLFGSRARGTAHGESDVDIAVVLDGADWRTRCEVIDLATDIGLESDLELSPTVFDRPTWERFRGEQRPLVADIEREGIPL